MGLPLPLACLSPGHIFLPPHLQGYLHPLEQRIPEHADYGQLQPTLVLFHLCHQHPQGLQPGKQQDVSSAQAGSREWVCVMAHVASVLVLCRGLAA